MGWWLAWFGGWFGLVVGLGWVGVWLGWCLVWLVVVGKILAWNGGGFSSEGGNFLGDVTFRKKTEKSFSG